MVAPLSSGPPPETSRKGLPQVWPSRQEKVWTDMACSLRRHEEALNLARRPQPHDRLSLAQELALDGETLAVPAMRLDRVVEDRIAAEEGVTPGLAVAGAPEIFPGRDAAQGAPEQAPHHQRKRQVEPDQRVGGAPDEVAHMPVIARHDPARISRQGADLVLDTVTEQIERGLLPVPAPEERVEFDHPQAGAGRESFREPALSRSRGAENDNALHLTPRRHSIWERRNCSAKPCASVGCPLGSGERRCRRYCSRTPTCSTRAGARRGAA